jgi:hypothetical protein
MHERLERKFAHKFKQLLVPICYFSALAIAMVGWLLAIGWVVVVTANWFLT